MQRFLSGKFVSIAAANGLAAAAASQFLGGVAGWMAPGRAGAGLLVGDLLPLFQFIALGALLDNVLWIMAYRPAGGRHAPRLPRLALHIASFLIYAVLVAASINLVFHQSLAGILGASGVIGLVLGFALRGLVSDIFSGIALQLDHSVGLGDWLDFQHRGRDYSGQLVEIDWRTAVFADRFNNIVLVPNGEFANLVVTNRSRPGANSEFSSYIELDAEHDELRVRAILQGALNRAVADGAVLAEPAPHVRIAAVKDGALSYRLYYCIDMAHTSPGKGGNVVLGHSVAFLKAAGVPLTRTQHTVLARAGATGDGHIAHPRVRQAMLESVGFLSILAPADLARVAAGAQPLRLPAGHQLLRAGEPGDSMFVLSEGALEVVIDGAGGELVVGRLWPGDCVGEMSLLTGAARSASVRSTAPSVLFEIGRATMADILAGNPALTDRIAAIIDARQKSNLSLMGEGEAGDAETARPASVLDNIRRFFRL